MDDILKMRDNDDVGMRHDVKNSLSSALALLEWVKQTGDRSVIPVIEESLRYAIDVVDFHQDGSPRSDMLESVQHVMATFGWRFGQQRIATRLWSDHCPPYAVDISRAPMRRVFYNIIDNACDAMPDGGTLDVHVARSGPWVTVTITDSGIGMDAGQLARFGQVEWTTKPDGHGVGVVSAMRLLREAGGDMHVTSSAGQGTHVIVNGPVSHFQLE